MPPPRNGNQVSLLHHLAHNLQRLVPGEVIHTAERLEQTTKTDQPPKMLGSARLLNFGHNHTKPFSEKRALLHPTEQYGGKWAPTKLQENLSKEVL